MDDVTDFIELPETGVKGEELLIELVSKGNYLERLMDIDVYANLECEMDFYTNV